MEKVKRILSGMLICSFTLSNIPYYCNVNSIKHKNKSIVKAADLVSPDGYSYTTTNDGVVITGYSGKETDLKIPSTIDSKDVIEIGDKAFYKIGTLKSIDIPNTVKTIGGSAFAGCNNLSTVKLNEGLDIIDTLAFFDTAITEITIPASVESARNAFGSSASFYSPDYSNTKLKSVTFSEGATVVPESIFSDCIALTEVNLPDGITIIGADAFTGCTALTNFNMPNTIKRIGGSAFAGCNNLSTVKLNEGLDIIDTLAFFDTAITEITIPASVESARNAFGSSASFYSPDYSNTKLKSVTFSEGATVVPESIFSDCIALTEVNLPDGITKIESYAFAGCKALTDFATPNSVVTIEYSAFADCENLSTVKLNEGLKEIHSATFNNTAITEITIPSTVERAGNAFGYYDGINTNLKNITFSDGRNKIPDNICSYCNGLTEITIPEGITEIGKSSFSDCKFLTNIKLPDTLEKIDYEAFSGCEKLSQITLNQGLKEIGSSTFNNTAITDITIPSTVERAGNAFGYYDGENTKLTSASFAEGTEIIPENIFEYCTSLKTVHFPDTLKDIGNYAFSHCTNLSSITGGKDTISFHPYTFDGCESLFDKRFTLVDPSSYIQANADVASVNGIVNYTVRYQLKDNVAANSSNHCLHLDIPEGMTIIPDSMVSNVFDVSEIDYGSNSFEVNNTKGIVKFSCRILEYGDYNVGAYLSFDYNNDYWEQSVGTLEVDVPKITCSSIETTNQYNIDVHGIAEKGKDIDIYVDGKKNTTVKTNEHTGKYTVNITLPEKKSGESYNIYAQSGQLLSDEITVKYEEDKPAIKSVALIYNDDQRADITKVFTEGASPVFTLTSTYYQFEIEADYNDKISKMYVTSTKGKDVKYLEAYWDNKKQCWITNGYFDEDNYSYIPGTLGILVDEKIIIDYEIISDKEDQLNLPNDLLSECDYNAIINTEKETLVEISNSNISENDSLQFYSIYENNDTYYNGNKISVEEIANAPVSFGYFEVSTINLPDNKIKKYYASIPNDKDINKNLSQSNSSEYFDDKVVLSNINILEVEFDNSKSNNSNTSYKLNELYLTGNNDNTYNFINDVAEELIKDDFKDAVKDSIQNMAKRKYYINNNRIAYDYVDSLGQWYDVMDNTIGLFQDAKDLKRRWTSTKDPDARLASVLLFVGQTANRAITFTAKDNPILSKIFVATFNAVFKNEGEELDRLIDKLNKYPSSPTGFAIFILDPSGYVYEAVDKNRIKDAEVTIYYKDPDSGKAALWNAADYDQANPLLTDSNGCYAWDVPEGQWKVVCKKEGYETVESEWLGVPPVQTDVNLSLVSKAVPEIISAELENGKLTVIFSKFVDVSTVTDKSLGTDNNAKLTITPQVLTKGDKFADTFIVTGAEKAKEITITDGIKSYAGVSAKAGKFVLKQDEPITTSSTLTTTTTTIPTSATTSQTTVSTTTTSKLSIEKTSISLKNGDQYTIKANQTGLTYSSNNKSVAVVSKEGVVTAISEGEATISVINSDSDVVQIKIVVEAVGSTKPKLGDVNGDNIIDGRDASDVLSYYAITSTGGKFDNNSFKTENADFNEDGVLDGRDASAILAYYAKSSTAA